MRSEGGGNGTHYQVTKIGDCAFIYCYDLSGVNIPKGITYIGHSAFMNCQHIPDIIIPERVTTIQGEAFYGCTGLTKITLPSHLTNIGTAAFGECSNITSLIIPESLAKIDTWGFIICSIITSLVIPKSVNYIGFGAFVGSDHLESIVVDETNTRYNSADSCNGIIETRYNSPIAGCKNTVIPNTVTTIIGEWAFKYCHTLTDITIPESVIKIESMAFQGCGLTNITIPKSVTNIENDAFSYCSELISIVSLIEDVFETGSYCFDRSPYVTLYVPMGLVGTYQPKTGTVSRTLRKSLPHSVDVGL